MKEKDLDRDTIVAYHAYLQNRIRGELNSLSLGPGSLPCRIAIGLVILAFISLIIGILLIVLRNRHLYLVDWGEQFLGPFFIILVLLCCGGATHLAIMAKRLSNKYRRELYFRPLGDYGIAIVHKSHIAKEEELKSELKSGTTPHKKVLPRSEAYSSYGVHETDSEGRPRGPRGSRGQENRAYDYNTDHNRPPDDRRRRPDDQDRRRPPPGDRDRDRRRPPDDRDRRPPDDRDRDRRPDDRERRRPPPDDRDRRRPRLPDDDKDGRRPPDDREGRRPPDDREGRRPPGDREGRRPPDNTEGRRPPDDREGRRPPDDRDRQRPPPDDRDRRRPPDDHRRPAPQRSLRPPPADDASSYSSQPEPPSMGPDNSDTSFHSDSRGLPPPPDTRDIPAQGRARGRPKFSAPGPRDKPAVYLDPTFGEPGDSEL